MERKPSDNNGISMVDTRTVLWLPSPICPHFMKQNGEENLIKHVTVILIQTWNLELK